MHFQHSQMKDYSMLTYGTEKNMHDESWKSTYSGEDGANDGEMDGWSVPGG